MAEPVGGVSLSLSDWVTASKIIASERLLEDYTTDERLDLWRAVERGRERYDRCQMYMAFPAEGPRRRGLYPKVMSFFRAGASARQRGMIAANRVGKTYACGYESSLHLTGDYPDWWEGRRFDAPGEHIIAGKKKESVRDIQVPLMLGRARQVKERGSVRRNRVDGTGFIPLSRIDETSVTWHGGGSRIVDECLIRYGRDSDPLDESAWSKVNFKSYEQGRDSFEGTAKQSIWNDEEPPYEIWQECLVRTMTTGGVIYLSFTPLDGLTETVLGFLPEYRDVLDQAEQVWDPVTDRYGEGMEETDRMSGSMQKALIQDAASDEGFWLDEAKYLMRIGWADKPPHLDEATMRQIEAELRKTPHLKNARMNGLPALGEGRVYPIAFEDVSCVPFAIPDSWPRWWALDPGHKRTACLFFAHDPDADVIYVVGEYYAGQAPMFRHAMAIKTRGEWVPGVMDASGRTSNVEDGVRMVEGYRRQGLNVSPADKSVSAGIEAVLDRLMSGRLIFFRCLPATEMEFGIYRFEVKGNKSVPVKQMDHAMDALRYGVMSGLDVAITKLRARLTARGGVRPAGRFVTPAADAIAGY